MVACIYVIMLIMQAVAVNFSFGFVFAAQSPAILTVTNVIPGATAAFECSLPSLTSPTPLDIYKDNIALYQCTNIAFTCGKASLDNDYSDVTFTDLGSASAKGTFKVANADQTRDGGEWTCKYGKSLISSPVTFVVSESTHVSDDCSCSCLCNHVSCWQCIVLICGLIIVAIVFVVWYCFCSDHSSPCSSCICGIIATIVVWCRCCIYSETNDSMDSNDGSISEPTTTDNISDVTTELQTLDTIQLGWRMHGLQTITPDLKAICGEQHHKVNPKDDGTHTVTFDNLAPDTNMIRMGHIARTN